MDTWGLKRKSQELSRFYKQCVLRSSFYDATKVVALDRIGAIEGKQLIDVSGDGKSIINLSADDLDKTRFATDENGIFAVISGMKLYPIEKTGFDKGNLKTAQKYERYTRSTLRRILHAPDILINYHAVYPILKLIWGISDGFGGLYLFIPDLIFSEE